MSERSLSNAYKTTRLLHWQAQRLFPTTTVAVVDHHINIYTFVACAPSLLHIENWLIKSDFSSLSEWSGSIVFNELELEATYRGGWGIDATTNDTRMNNEYLSDMRANESSWCAQLMAPSHCHLQTLRIVLIVSPRVWSRCVCARAISHDLKSTLANISSYRRGINIWKKTAANRDLFTRSMESSLFYYDANSKCLSLSCA